MRRVATVAEVRAADRAASDRVGEGRLIDAASSALAVTVLRLLGGGYGRRVLVIAGAGHNGADAVWAGAKLARRGAAVTLLRSSDLAPDEHGRAAQTALAAAGGIETFGLPPRADAVLDGMVGVGASGRGLRGRAAEIAAALSGRSALVVAVDLPSGIDAATGRVEGPAVRADVTVTFGALKPGLVVGAGADHAGIVEVADVGLGAFGLAGAGGLGLLDAADVAELLPTPAPTSDKYSRGVVGVVAGSAAYPGAALLVTGAAVRAGAGYVRYVGEQAAVAEVMRRWPSVVGHAGGPLDAGRVDAWVVGPGLGTDKRARDAVRRALDSDLPVLLDADGLALAGADGVRGRGAPTLLTPHAGEFGRLVGAARSDVEADPLGQALRAAADLGIHVLLKGQRTVVAAPDGRALVNPTGSTWLSTAGTGDVLSGAAGAMIAAAAKRGSLDLLTVAAAAAFLHGLAAHAGPVPLCAADLIDTWPAAVASVRADGEEPAAP